MEHPQLSVVIASRSREAHLQTTLTELRRQQYPGEIEVIVLDDASPVSLQAVVTEAWPTARFIRKEVNVGQCACRTEGFRIAKGEFVLQLDDDAHPVDADCISRAVALFQAKPEIGIVNCYSFNGQQFPQEGLPAAESRYCVSFHGCAVFFRAAALRQVGGYLDFLERQWEEEALSIRIMEAGWAVYFDSSLYVHHRLSSINRSSPRAWAYGIRNKLWGLLMYWPLYRLPLDMTWTLGLAFWDGFRLRRPRELATALWCFLKGSRRVLSLRSPMDTTMMRRYDALRFGIRITTAEQFSNPPSIGPGTVIQWFTRLWWNRPRERSFWDRRQGDIGSTDTVKFAHEYVPPEKGSDS